MKTRTCVVVLILVLAVMIVAGSCATEKQTVKVPKEPFYGTWVNPDYDDVYHKWSKHIKNHDGTFVMYVNITSTKPTTKGTIIITEKWSDHDGNFWYKTEDYYGPYFEGKKVSSYSLCRINESGTILEYVWSQVAYPARLDPTDGSYRIYYRQE